MNTSFTPPTRDQGDDQAQDKLSQFIYNLMPKDTPAPLPTPMSAGPVAPQTSAPASAPVVQPTDDIAIPQKNYADRQAELTGANAKLNDVNSRIAAVPTADPAQYKPHWYDRLLGIAVGTAAGMDGSGAAGPAARNVAFRRLNSAESRRQSLLEPLTTERQGIMDTLPFLKEQGAEAYRQLTETRQQGVANAREKELGARADKYGSAIVSGSEYKDPTSPTGWFAQTASGDKVTFTPKATEKPVAEPKNYEEAIAGSSAAYAKGNTKEGDRMKQLAHDMLDARIKQARESRAPKGEGDTRGKPKDFTKVETDRNSAWTKAKAEYDRVVKRIDPSDKEGMQQARDDMYQARQQAQDTYESSIDRFGGSSEHVELPRNLFGEGPAEAPAAAPMMKITEEIKHTPKPAGKPQAQAGPPASLWKSKENKVLTLKGPDGKTEKWQLKNGTPTKIG